MIDNNLYTLTQSHYDMPAGTPVYWIRMSEYIQGEVVTSLDKENTQLRMVPLDKLKRALQ